MPLVKDEIVQVVPIPLHPEAVVQEVYGLTEYWTWYPVIALFPVFTGAVQYKLTSLSPGFPATPVGGFGTPLE